MNGGFRVRHDGQFVVNSLNSRIAQKGIQEGGKTNETPGTVAEINQGARASPLPSIALPKGGGAIRGIGEKFAANPVTGTGSLNVPIFTSPGRSGFGPQLSLSYDSGSGNGPFGFGWSLSLPSITRKTDKGLPKYQDANESDVFILSGAEDLVPVLVEKGGQWVRKTVSPRIIGGNTYRIDLYRPRIEGLFARIERWTRQSDGDVHWRSISKDNILTVYGRDEKSRIADPADESRIFSWLICESYDDKGNAIVYEYTTENEIGVDLFQVNERNRARTANRYLKRIRYGNRKPLLLDTTVPSFRRSHIVQPDFTSAGWMFEVVFDYEEGHYKELPYDNDPSKHRFVQASESKNNVWSCRPDPFSTYRAGFEIRTYRRCKRVLMFHIFLELGSEPCLVRSTEFDYKDMDYKKYKEPVPVEDELEHKGSTRFASFIQKVAQAGYVYYKSEELSEPEDIKYLTYLKKSLPPLEFEYSKAIIQEEIKEIDAESLENLPYGLDGTGYQLVDLDGEGISGILTEQAEAWFYKSNLGDGKFGPMVRVAVKPSLAVLNSGRTQLLDLAGDGQLDVVELDGPVPGFYERTYDQSWENFIPFTSLPNVAWKDPNLKFVDLTGDGHADVMVTENEVIAWYPSLAEEGFGEGEKVHQSFDEEKGPHLVFADGTQSIYLSDMSGDGLSDLVRIRNGEVCYWPNLGYGRFGPKVTMDNAPWFDSPDQFDQKRIRLADVDGSGTTDIIYLGRNGVQIYFNHSGNSWSSVRMLSSFPRIDNLSSIQVADLFGNGTACLVWSSPLLGDSRRQMRYIDLMGGQKPHLLIVSKNNLGAETKVTYVASNKFYLDDKTKGKPWITRIPFPVHVVERVETCDRISRNRFVTRYAYHHGYFDGIEREFRGFGMVEQWDSEEIGTVGPEVKGKEENNWDAASFVPPVLTSTWFHTGAYFEDGRISKQFKDEYYREGDPSMHEGQLEPQQLESMLLSDTVLPDNLTAEEAREVCRSLKGSILRHEVYALDRRPDGTLTEESDRPYTVSERNYTIKCLQPREGNRHAVFFIHPRETIDFHYERKLYDITDTSGQTQKRVDPRVTHAMTLVVDDFGNVLQSAAISYGRRYDDPDKALTNDDRKKQKPTLNNRPLALATYTESSYTNPIDNPVKKPDAYRAPLPCETRTYELLKMTPDANGSFVTNLFRFNEILDKINGTSDGKIKGVLDGNHDIPYEDIEAAGAKTDNAYRRLIEHVRTLYRPNDLGVTKNDQLALLPLGTVESLALPGEIYKLAFTPSLVAGVHNGQVTDAMFEIEGRYVHSEGDANWWIPSGRIFYSPGSTDTSAQELNFASQHFFLAQRYRDPFHTDAIRTETFISYDAYDLLVQKTRDALGNRVTTGERDEDDNLTTQGNDYRVLQPRLVMDPNRNCTSVAFDAMGMVVGTAVMGKPEDNPKRGDRFEKTFSADLTQAEVDRFFASPKGLATLLLDDATTRIIYDLTGYWREPDLKKKPPAYAATLARETHASDPVPADGLKIQVSFSYSDGFGREIQKKIQAEPGPVEGVDDNVNPRWVGSGWTIFNNKGKPIRKYEPFFSATHRFEFSRIEGVSSIIFYDPVERVVATLHPNHIYEKLVFDPWQQKTFDVNDTVAGDPRTDEDISGYVAKYFVTQPITWQTWYEQRISGALGTEEQKAAQETKAHDNTPTVAYFDTLGRSFLTVANNGKDKNGKDIFYKTRIVLDIEGNQRDVIDAKDRVVMRYDYDMLGNRIKQESMDAGTRWILNNVTDKPIRMWDSRGFQRCMTYDALQRPVELFVTDNKGMKFLAEKTEYGESKTPNPEITNHRLKTWKVYDGAGVLVNESYDFKGNLVLSKHQLLPSPYHKTQVNWTQKPQPDETFTTSTLFDALNRQVQIVAPHSNRPGTKFNVTQPVYNEANLLERVEVWLEQNAEPNGLLNPNTATQHAVTNIDYNAKGQRLLIQYGNGAETYYSYDPKTFRLIHLYTRRSAAFIEDCAGDPPLPRFPSPVNPPHGQPCGLQNIHYTYDPVGNITFIRDYAQQTIYFRNRCVMPNSEYTYDAIYRLTQATGREHLGQVGGAPVPTSPTDVPRINLDHPNDCKAMGDYLQEYIYDEVGNVLEMVHQGTSPINPGWTRTFNYSEPNNRLSYTEVNNITERYKHDEHGNMNRMSHLNHIDPGEPNMHWDFKDQLHIVDKSDSCSAYYVYDAAGQRVRKVVEKNNGTMIEERIYLGDFEVYRKRNGAVTLERETLHIMDDKQRIALVETRTQGNDGSPAQLVRYQFGNHLGSASLELDKRGQIISYEEYYPYGSTSYQAVDKSIKAAAKRYRYTGKERDEESGLYYHGARYYAPWLGRWTACDPGGLIEGLNLFMALGDNPLNRKDSTGLQSVGELIEEQALRAAKEERYISLYLWSFAGVAWSVFGAEGVSKVAAGKASTRDYASAAIEVASVIPVVKIAKAGKGLLVAKEAAGVVAKETSPVVAKKVTEEVTKEAAQVATKKAAPEVAKEAAKTQVATEVKAAQTATTAVKPKIPSTAKQSGGRLGKQQRLKDLLKDPKVSKADKGWIQQELKHIERGGRGVKKTKYIRVPPGKELAHRRGFEARKGFGYKHSDLQNPDLHKLQHKHEGYK